MNRGDTRTYVFKIKKKGVTPTEYIDGSQFTEIEVQFNAESTFNSVKKLKSKNEVSWDATNQRFECFLSQEDTFTLGEGNNKVQVRLEKEDGDYCRGTIQKDFDLNACLSKEILG